VTARGAVPVVVLTVRLSHDATGSMVSVQTELHLPGWPFCAPSSHTSPLDLIPSPHQRGATKAHSLCVIGAHFAFVTKSYGRIVVIYSYLNAGLFLSAPELTAVISTQPFI